jgi:tRNA-specific 2-thiouridylase
MAQEEESDEFHSKVEPVEHGAGSSQFKEPVDGADGNVDACERSVAVHGVPPLLLYTFFYLVASLFHCMGKKRMNILVAMSGGVDSSVAAGLLLRAGHEVTGAYMKQWSDAADLTGVCEWKKDRRDALRVAAALGIPLLTLDFEKEYRTWVTAYLFREYRKGNTPNPDVLCNRYIKFGAWLDTARRLGFDALATGHYAQVKKIRGAYRLLQAEDGNKDQTYFLHQLDQAQLAQTMFPIGHLTKPGVRRLARQMELPTAKNYTETWRCGYVARRQGRHT